MKKSSTLIGLLLQAAVARAEKFDHLGEEVAALMQWLLLAVGGALAVVVVLIFGLIARQRRKRQQAREREKAFYESLGRR